MDSIAVTQLNEPRIRYAPFRRGRRRHITFEEALQLPAVDSTVGTNAGNVLDTSLRKSKRRPCIVEFRDDPPTQFLEALVPVDRRRYIMWPTAFDLITYEAGGFFAEHRDHRHNKRHYATLLIFPPAVGAYAHTGGTLIIKYDDDTMNPFVFESSANQVWTFIAFHTHLRHECLPVSWGQRVVFKTELELSCNPTWDPDAHVPRDPSPVLFDVRPYHNTIVDRN